MLVFFSDQDENVYGRVSINKYKYISNRTLFMFHGDERTHVKGHYFVERMQINMIFAEVLHILYLLNLLLLLLLLLLLGGRGVTPLLHDCQVKTTVIQI